MTAGWGVSSMVAPLARVAVRPPSSRGDYAAAHWAQPLDLARLLEQHQAFTGLLADLGCAVERLEAAADMPDACFVFDPVLVTPLGAIELRAAKEARAGEPPLLAAELAALGVPLLGRLTPGAYADAGDMCWLDDRALAIGRSYRTNEKAISEIAELLAPAGIDVLSFDVPHDQGPEYCLHLLSFISPVRPDLAVVFEPLAPVPLLQELRARGIDWIPLPAQDYASLGCNVLAVEPSVVVIAAGNVATAAALRDRGVRVHEYEASEINKGEGGPTCLTRPILRAG